MGDMRLRQVRRVVVDPGDCLVQYQSKCVVTKIGDENVEGFSLFDLMHADRSGAVVLREKTFVWFDHDEPTSLGTYFHPSLGAWLQDNCFGDCKSHGLSSLLRGEFLLRREWHCVRLPGGGSKNRDCCSVIHLHKSLTRLDCFDMSVAKIAAKYDLRCQTFYDIERDTLHSVS